MKTHSLNMISSKFKRSIKDNVPFENLDNFLYNLIEEIAREYKPEAGEFSLDKIQAELIDKFMQDKKSKRYILMVNPDNAN